MPRHHQKQQQKFTTASSQAKSTNITNPNHLRTISTKIEPSNLIEIKINFRQDLKTSSKAISIRKRLSQHYK